MTRCSIPERGKVRLADIDAPSAPGAQHGMLCCAALKKAVKEANTFPCKLSFNTVPDSQDLQRLHRLNFDECA